MRRLRILEVAGSGTVGTARMGPVSTVIHELSKELSEIGHHVEIADARGSERKVALQVMELTCQ